MIRQGMRLLESKVTEESFIARQLSVPGTKIMGHSTKWLPFACCSSPKLNLIFFNTESGNTHVQLFKMRISRSQATLFHF